MSHSPLGGRPGNRSHARRLHAAALLACGTFAAGILLPATSPAAQGAYVDPSIVPTVHPILTPTSAIPAPLQFAAEQTSVWRADADQRMLLAGNVVVNIGYRRLRAQNAAVWLTPSRESAANTYDVAIYLSGNVEVREGPANTASTTVGKELLVTTRIAETVQLTGTPSSKAEDDNPIVKRGDQLRTELLSRPLAPLHLANFEMTTTEQALQSGWIARGPNNRIVAGPGDIQVTRDSQGRIIPGSAQTVTSKPAKPRPSVFLTYDTVEGEQIGDETVTVLRGVYLFYDAHNNKPPIEFRAQRMVIFSPRDVGTTRPATNPATAPGVASANAAAPPATPSPATQPAAPRRAPREQQVLQYVTGAYMEGDVTIDSGDLLQLRADRAYYDFTSQRAIMLDATLSTVDEVRKVPLYLRAAEIRQLSAGEWAARKASFSTSEFFTPHYHIGASEVYLRDITPQFEGAGGGPGQGGDTGVAGLMGGGASGPRTFQFKAKNATGNVVGLPIFFWPYLAGDTGKNEIPLRTVRVSNSRTYGLSLLTDWDLFGLAGQPQPEGVNADLNLDYFGKRGPAGGVNGNWATDEDRGILRTYALMNQGNDRLGRDRPDVPPQSDSRGRATFRDQHDLGDGLTLQLEASYISDPTFLEQFFTREFESDKEQETSFYLKKQGETDAFTFLGKFNLFDFTATADQVDDQFSTEKKPELKYWRIGDSFFDLFTFYSENGLANVHDNITNFTPAQIGLGPSFLGLPAVVTPANQTFRSFYRSLGWTSGDVLRGDSRQEIDMPLQIGDAKVVPYLTGRVTYWDQGFPDVPVPGGSVNGSTTRLWGAAGIRSSMLFWHVYDDVNSRFLDVHRLRHIIEPQFNIFVAGANQDRSTLQPFDRDVEGMSTASGSQLSLNQKWQTKRGGEGHWRDVDWVVLNVSWNQYYNRDRTTLTDGTISPFFPQLPTRGFFFQSRPELSLVQNSINVDGVWRAGERFRFLGEANYSLESARLEQLATGIAVDQSPVLSYFFGNRYIRALKTDEWTIAMDYQLTRKYQLIAAESFDFQTERNILSSFTLVRKLPRFNTALTVTYDANNADTSVIFTAWPEGLPATSFYNTGSPRGFRN